MIPIELSPPTDVLLVKHSDYALFCSVAENLGFLYKTVGVPRQIIMFHKEEIQVASNQVAIEVTFPEKGSYQELLHRLGRREQ